MPEPATQSLQQSGTIATKSASGVAELSVPVEFAADGQQAVIARVLFNAPIKRDYLTRLKTFLDAWEKMLPEI